LVSPTTLASPYGAKFSVTSGHHQQHIPSASTLKAALLEKRIAKEREQRIKVQKRLEDELERVKLAVT
jgi:hypothetical protein